jgi:hypothetical protein
MKKLVLSAAFMVVSIAIFAQVGIGTSNPKGALDVNSETLGLIIPRVPDFTLVTATDGTAPVNGTFVYDTNLKQLMIYIDGSWLTMGKNTAGDTVALGVIIPQPFSTSNTYIKASNTGPGDQFGYSVSLSADGATLAVGAYAEDSNATGVNGAQVNNNVSSSGAVYVYD